ncbi:MAG TPA: porin family protein [Gemmatimonadales bacterium]
MTDREKAVRGTRGIARRLGGALIASLLAFAPLAGQMPITVVAGVTSSNWSFSSGASAGQHALTGPVVGIATTLPLGSRFGFSPEILYVARGASLLFGGNVQIDFRVHYVAVPLLLRYTEGTVRSIRPFIELGPVVSVVAACSTKATNSASNGGTVIVEPCTTGYADITQDQPDAIDFGLAAGVGASEGRFSVSVRFDDGVSDIFSRYRTSGGSTRNTAWTGMVAVRL